MNRIFLLILLFQFTLSGFAQEGAGIAIDAASKAYVQKLKSQRLELERRIAEETEFLNSQEELKKVQDKLDAVAVKKPQEALRDFQGKFEVLQVQGSFFPGEGNQEENERGQDIRDLYDEMRYYIANYKKVVEDGVDAQGNPVYKKVTGPKGETEARIEINDEEERVLGRVASLSMQLGTHLKLRNGQCNETNGIDSRQALIDLSYNQLEKDVPLPMCSLKGENSGEILSPQTTEMLLKINEIAQTQDSYFLKEKNEFPYYPLDSKEESKLTKSNNAYDRYKERIQEAHRRLSATAADDIQEQKLAYELEKLGMYERIQKEMFFKTQEETIKGFMTNALLFQDKKFPEKDSKRYRELVNQVQDLFCPEIKKSGKTNVSMIAKAWGLDGINTIGPDYASNQQNFDYARERCRSQMKEAAQRAISYVQKEYGEEGIKTNAQLKEKFNQIGREIKPSVEKFNKEHDLKAFVNLEYKTGKKVKKRVYDRQQGSYHEFDVAEKEYHISPDVTGNEKAYQDMKEISESFYSEALDSPEGRLMTSTHLGISPFNNIKTGYEPPKNAYLKTPQEIEDEKKIPEAIKEIQKDMINGARVAALDFYKLYDKAMAADWMNQPNSTLMLDHLRKRNLEDFKLAVDMDPESFMKVMSSDPRYNRFMCTILNEMEQKTDSDEAKRKALHKITMVGGLASMATYFTGRGLIWKGVKVAGGQLAKAGIASGFVVAPIGLEAGKLSARRYSELQKQKTAMLSSYLSGKSHKSFIDFYKLDQETKKALKEMKWEARLAALEVLPALDIGEFVSLVKGAHKAGRYLSKIDDFKKFITGLSDTADNDVIKAMNKILKSSSTSQKLSQESISSLKVYLAILEKSHAKDVQKFLKSLDKEKYLEQFADYFSHSCMAKLAYSDDCMDFFRKFIGSIGSDGLIGKAFKKEMDVIIARGGIPGEIVTHFQGKEYVARVLKKVDDGLKSSNSVNRRAYTEIQEALELAQKTEGPELHDKMVDITGMFLRLSERFPKKFPLAQVSTNLRRILRDEKEIDKVADSMVACLKSNDPAGCFENSRRLASLKGFGGSEGDDAFSALAKKLDMTPDELTVARVEVSTDPKFSNIFKQMEQVEGMTDAEKLEAESILTDLVVIYKKNQKLNNDEILAKLDVDLKSCGLP